MAAAKKAAARKTVAPKVIKKAAPIKQAVAKLIKAKRPVQILKAKPLKPFVRKPKPVAPPIETLPPIEKVAAVRQPAPKIPFPPLMDKEGQELPSFLRDPRIWEAKPTPKYTNFVNGRGRRESIFDREVASEVCKRIAEGDTLIGICDDPEKEDIFPTPGGFIYWVNQADELDKLNIEDVPVEMRFMRGLGEEYRRAQLARMAVYEERYVETTFKIRKSEKRTVIESAKDGRSVKVETFDDTNRVQMELNSLQWLFGKISPRYQPPKQAQDGDPRTLTIHGGLGVEHVPEDTQEEIQAYESSMEDDIIADSTENAYKAPTGIPIINKVDNTGDNNA